ncbi:MAG: TolC family outer membrane protein [Alphaproteobacteria bacterium]
MTLFLPLPLRAYRRLTIAAVLAGLTLLAPVMAAGQTLDAAMVLAYENNPELLAARAALRAVDESLPQALAGWRPTVTLSGSAGKERIDTTTSTTGGVSNRTPVSATLSVSQPLFRGFRTQATTRLSKNEIQRQRAVLVATEQTVLADTVTAYMDVLRDQAILELRRNNEQVLERQLEATQDRFRVGELTRTDVAQGESRLALAASERITAEATLHSSRAVFERVVGVPPGTLVDPDLPTSLPESLDAALAGAQVHSPAVVQAQFAAQAAADDVASIEGELLPAVSLTGSLSSQEDSLGANSERESASIAAELSVPLYQAGAVYSRVREAKQRASQRRIEVENARRNAAELATVTWQELQSATGSIASQAARVQASDLALEGVRQESLVGARTVLDVLDAEQELLDARVSLVGAQRDQIVAAYRLLAAAGVLTAADLALAVEIYDMDEHYRSVRGRFFGTGIDP